MTSSPPRAACLAGGLALALACAGGSNRSQLPATPLASTTRSVEQGSVVGTEGRYGSHVWKGIPFAKPPVGEFRWRAPRPPEPWSGVREALEFASPCPQFASPIAGVEDAEPGSFVGDEDCLYLNVWTPAFAEGRLPGGDQRLPVMVWIHGGGNTIGHTAYYDGGNLAVKQDVVVVSVQYRLGAFGWFRHPALRPVGTSPEDASGNYGTLDLIRALRWVQRNASAFGGDPDRVTIFGESAGGTNVYSLLVSPQAKGLYARAISQSGGAGSTAVDEAENLLEEGGGEASGREIGLRQLVRDGRAKDRSAARQLAAEMSLGELASYLRGVPAAELLETFREGGGLGGMYRTPTIIRDGNVLPEDDFGDVLARGDYNQVPVILGTNRDESKLFQFMNPKNIRVWFWLFPRLRDPGAYNLEAEYQSGFWKARGVDEPARAMRAVQGPTVHAYRFDWDEEPTLLFSDLGEILGAAHGFEIPFVFGHFHLGQSGEFLFDDDNLPGRLELSDAMMSYWAAFAYDGSPGRGRENLLPEWRAWDDSSPEAHRYILLDTRASGGIRMVSEPVMTHASLLARMDTDPRLADGRIRCRLLGGLLRFGERVSEDQYAERCPEHPLDRMLAEIDE